MLYLFDLFFIFSLIFIAINHIPSFKLDVLVSIPVSEYFLSFLDDNVHEESE